jgi:XrtJ-associated TM-motif-TM protein
VGYARAAKYGDEAMKRSMAELMHKAWLGGGIWLAGMACAHADTTGGCADSPENPTVVLVMVGLAAAAMPRLRAGLRKLRKET